MESKTVGHTMQINFPHSLGYVKPVAVHENRDYLAIVFRQKLQK